MFQARSGKVTDSDPAAAVSSAQSAFADLDHVSAVTGPATADVGSSFVSDDGTIGYIQVRYDESAQELGDATFDRLESAAQPLADAGLRVEYGGPVVDYANRADAGDSDRVGVAVAVVVLLVKFGSVVSMTLPLVTSFAGLGVALSIIALVAGVTDIGTVAPTLAHDALARHRHRPLPVHRHPAPARTWPRGWRSSRRSGTRSPPPGRPCCSPGARW